jgi:hypothetical protein
MTLDVAVPLQEPKIIKRLPARLVDVFGDFWGRRDGPASRFELILESIEDVIERYHTRHAGATSKGVSHDGMA